MGGGGGGGSFGSRSPEELWALVRKAEDHTASEIFDSQLADFLAQLLSLYNGRDVALVAQRLDQLRSGMEGAIEGTLDQMFAGSVAKHTYVDGLSDIDSLVIVNETKFDGCPPAAILGQMENILRQKCGKDAVVSVGRMAVTVTYPDGMVIQLLPALRTKDGLIRVPSSRTDGWSKINPMTFREALTKRNAECGGKLVATIKLAKAISAQLPEAQRLSGYHMESLGIAAFRGYQGEKTTSAMLPAFFERAKDLVLSPIVDSTGQSVHVDSYLGPARSAERQVAGHICGRIAKRMKNASAATSIGQWQALFGAEF